VQGTGQITYAIPSGDGFVTDSGVINSFKMQLMRTSRYEITGVVAGLLLLLNMVICEAAE
jgi:hypothetical protein